MRRESNDIYNIIKGRYIENTNLSFSNYIINPFRIVELINLDNRNTFQLNLNCNIGNFLFQGGFGKIYLTHPAGIENIQFIIKVQNSTQTNDNEFNILFHIAINMIDSSINYSDIPVPAVIFKGNCNLNGTSVPYLIEEYIKGVTLAGQILNTYELYKLIRGLWAELYKTHKYGKIAFHGDLHLGNVLISENRRNKTKSFITIIDWGKDIFQKVIQA